MLFVGYTLILLVDRVLFDTHGMLDAKDHHDKESKHSDHVQVNVGVGAEVESKGEF